MPTISNDSTTCVPGDFFRGLHADATLHNLYGRENSLQYETVAATLNFLTTARTFGLESPIGENVNEGGYSVYIKRQEWAELLKQSQQSLEVLPENFAVNPVWQRIMAFADQWYAGACPCNSLSDGLWFELDVSGPPPVLPIPSIFFGVKNNTVDESITAIMNGLSALNLDLSSIQKDLLVTYLRTMGPLSSSFQVGLMLARPAAPLRLCAFYAKLPDVLTGLKDLGITTLEAYPDFRQEFLHLAPRFSGVDLDIGDAFGAKVGLEFKFTSVTTLREQRESQPGQAFLQWLVNKGWCLPEKSQAVLNWIGGYKYHPNPEDFWSPRKTIFRTISHIKLDFQPGRPPRAKAYLEYNVQ